MSVIIFAMMYIGLLAGSIPESLAVLISGSGLIALAICLRRFLSKTDSRKLRGELEKTIS